MSSGEINRESLREIYPARQEDALSESQSPWII